MEVAEVKGIATSLSSLFPIEDSQKAANRLHESLSEKNQEIKHLQGFISDNTNLINLVQKLPEELYYDVIVPFGKAAFFPGRLVHTNEFLVLLGEGYHVERTSTKTVEILKRRGKYLESHVDSLKAMIEDLKVKASFFDTTASEAAEGLVDIREDYVEEVSPKRESKICNEKNIDEEEYARLMLRLDELERDELAAGSNYEDIEDEETKALFYKFSYKKLLDDNPSFSKCSGLTVPSLPKDDLANHKSLSKDTTIFESANEVKKLPTVEKNIQSQSSSSNEASNPGFNTEKAFTGSIMERTNNIPREGISTVDSAQPSKPVSRFKMQRR